MRYFKFQFLLCFAAIALPIRAGAQQSITTTSQGILADFKESARSRVNYYRAMAKLPPILDDPAVSAGALNHARYLVKNGIAGGNMVLENGQLNFQTPQDAFREEERGRPFYTDNGASVGRNGTVVTANEIKMSGAEFVDRVMTMPFSGLTPMVPQFSVAGLGAYCDPGQCAIVISGRFALEKPMRIALYDGPASDRFWNPNLGLIPMESGRLRTPVEFPPDGATINFQSSNGDDYPDPLTSCPGYKAPTGAPISIQLGQGYGPDDSLEVSSVFVTRDSAEIETCLITSTSYTGRDAAQTQAGKTGLANIGAAVILPRAPLAPGQYKVALKENNKLYEWSFTVAAVAPPAAAPAPAAPANRSQPMIW